MGASLHPSILKKGDYHEIQSKHRFSVISHLAHSHRLVGFHIVRRVVRGISPTRHRSWRLYIIEPLAIFPPGSVVGRLAFKGKILPIPGSKSGIHDSEWIITGTIKSTNRLFSIP